MNQTNKSAGKSNAEKLTVFYDAACPLCRREIAFYRRRSGAETIRWIDVNSCEGAEVRPGLSKAHALARFHVVDDEGRLLSGGRAFARLWQAFPAFRFWGSLLGRPPAVWVLDPAYEAFLRLRPWLQALARRS